MGSSNITLEEILRRKIKDTTEEFELFKPDDFDSDDPYSVSYDEYKAQFDGELRAYRDMFEAVCSGISEEDFIETFCERFDKYERIARATEPDDNIIDIVTGMARSEIRRIESGGYCSGVKPILNLFFPFYSDIDFE